MRSWAILALAVWLGGVSPLGAAEIKGGFDFGFWYTHNNLSSQVNFQPADAPYVQSQYSLLSLGLQTDISQLFGESAKQNGILHFKGRSYFNLGTNNYTFAFSESGRHELYEISLELPSVTDSLDLWFGRQRIYEAGGARVDGLRLVYRPTQNTRVGFFGGLSNDLRNQVGYLGPAYRLKPFSVDFLTAGLYSSYRGGQFRGDVAFHSLLYKSEIDRATLFAQGTYDLNSVWSFSGLLEGDVAGVSAFRLGRASVITRPRSGITNTLSFNMWRVLQFAASDLSAIPPPSHPLFDSTVLGGTQVTDSYYFGGRNHIMFRIFDRNYVFGAFQFMRRTFDDKNQLKYTVGYRDPRLFDSTFDLRVQLDLIDNYRGFNTGADLLLGKNFKDGALRFEAGGSLEGNEREVWQNLQPTTLPRTTEKEWSLRANGFYYPLRKLSLALQYAFRREVEINDLAAKIHLHELFFTTSWRF